MHTHTLLCDIAPYHKSSSSYIFNGQEKRHLWWVMCTDTCWSADKLSYCTYMYYQEHMSRQRQTALPHLNPHPHYKNHAEQNWCTVMEKLIPKKQSGSKSSKKRDPKVLLGVPQGWGSSVLIPTYNLKWGWCGNQLIGTIGLVLGTTL